MIAGRLGNTLFLASVAALVAVPVAILLGLIAARFRETWLDKTISIATLAAISMPEFFIGYILIFVFAVKLFWAPSIASVYEGMSLGEKLAAVALPVATLALVVVAHMMRMTRAAVINVMSSPYIEMAELKGVSRSRIIFRHALPNALSPIINVVVLNLAYLVVGVVVVEVVFVYPGMGQLMVDARRQARRAGGPGLRADLRRHLRPAQPDRRHPVDHRQPAAAAPEVSRCAGISLSTAIGFALIVLFALMALLGPFARALRRVRGRGRRLGSRSRPSSRSAPTASAGTS